MHAIFVFTFVLAIVIQSEAQLWKLPQKIFDNILRVRQGKNDVKQIVITEKNYRQDEATTTEIGSTATTVEVGDNDTTGTVSNEPQTLSTGADDIYTTLEPRNNEDYYLKISHKPQQVSITTSNISQNLLPLPASASAALIKPMKYHYYPHNQHMYLLPECAIQQVCNAVYIRLNWTQPLCACSSRYREPCSASLNADDQHTTELLLNNKRKNAVTLVKTCEPVTEMRICRTPRDWSLLALQNIRTGKSHYLVICRCTDTSILEGPMSHDQPTYASVPGIRVFGMMCISERRHRGQRFERDVVNPPFPWNRVPELLKAAAWN